MSIIDYSIKNRVVTIYLTVILIVGGILSYVKLGKLEDPEFRVKEAIVLTLYPGANPHQVELEVTDEIESALQQIGHTEYIESMSKAGYSEVKIKLKEDLKAEVIDQYWDNVRKKINDVQSKLPTGALPSIVMDDYGDVYGMFFAITSDGYSTDGYFSLLQAGNMENLYQDSVNQLEEHLKNVQAQYDVGVVAKVDVLRSEVSLANAQQQLIQATNNYDVAEASLNKIIGTSLDTTLKLKDSLQYTPYENDMQYCLDYASMNRAELEQSRLAVDAAKGAVKVAKSGFLPKVTASATESWGGSGSNWPGDDKENWSVGIGATMNIFDSGVTLSKVHAAEEKLLQAEETYRDTVNSVELEVRSNYLGLREAEKRISTTQVAVAKAEEDFHIAQVRYMAGVGTNLDVIDAQVALTEAKTNFVNALYDYNTSKIALETSMGVPVAVTAAANTTNLPTMSTETAAE